MQNITKLFLKNFYIKISLFVSKNIVNNFLMFTKFDLLITIKTLFD